MNLLHVVMQWKIRCLWRAGPEQLFQGYGGSILPLPSPACEKETGTISLATMIQQGRSLSRLLLLPALFSRCQGNCIWPSAQSLGDFLYSTPSLWSWWLCRWLLLPSSPWSWWLCRWLPLPELLLRAPLRDLLGLLCPVSRPPANSGTGVSGSFHFAGGPVWAGLVVRI